MKIFDNDFKESFFKEDSFDELPNGEKAWILNQIISSMNDEEAYYSGWLYIWPDGEDKESCMEDFAEDEDYQDLQDSFVTHYKACHADGLYRASWYDFSDNEWQDIVAYAHFWDKKLGLPPIEVLK